jgi:hypothetical protein
VYFLEPQARICAGSGNRKGDPEPGIASSKTGSSKPLHPSVKNHPNMKELRVQSRGKPYRICFAFDPRQTDILLIGGVKSGKNRTRQMVATADKIYDAYLAELKKEGLL